MSYAPHLPVMMREVSECDYRNSSYLATDGACGLPSAATQTREVWATVQKVRKSVIQTVADPAQLTPVIPDA